MGDEGKTIACYAAVAHEAGKPIVIETVKVAPPNPTEVRVQIVYTAVCRTDITYWKYGQFFPRIFGHEAAGIVESVGSEVRDVKPGDHVLTLFTGECKECDYCKCGKTNLCRRFKGDPERVGMVSDNRTRFSTQDGEPIYHFLGTSTFSQFTVVDQACVCVVNKEAPLDTICVLSCGVTTGIGAATKTARVRQGSTVAIFGLGTIGFAAAQGAKLAGASRIIGIDIVPKKLEDGLAMFGLTDTVNSMEGDKPVPERIREMTNGGADYTIECVGNVKLIRDAVESAHEGWGVTVVAGLDQSTKMLEVHPQNFLYGRTLTGTWFGGYKGRSELNELVEKYLSKELNLDDFITHKLPLAKINDAINLMQDSKSLRCVLEV